MNTWKYFRSRRNGRNWYEKCAERKCKQPFGRVTGELGGLKKISSIFYFEFRTHHHIAVRFIVFIKPPKMIAGKYV